MPSHDPVAAEVAPRDVVEVHAAALAAADPGGPAAELRQQRPGVGAAGERQAVVPIGRHEVVVRAEQAHGRDADGLLADEEWAEAADLPLDVELRTALFEAPD